ncbi:unnamed protein product, partial [Timema podura]|nr:unnamed protein product [Timema podura]
MVGAITMSATDEEVTEKSSILVKEYEEDLSDNLTFEGKRLSTYILPLNFNPRDIQTVARSVEFESALTLYPVSQPALFNHLNAYFSKLHAIREISELRHFIINTSSTTFGGHSAITWPIGNYPGTEPTTRFDVLRWDYFDQKHIYLNSDFSRKKELQGATKLAIEVILNSTISYIETKHQGQYQFQRLLNGYRRFDPSRGLNYKLDFELINVLNSKVVHKRIEVFEPLLKVEVVPMPYVTENTRVNMILPIATNDGAQALKFMEQYATVCMEKHDKTFLMLVLLYDPTVPGKGTKDDIFLNVKQMALSLSDQYKKYGNKIAWVSIKLSINSNYGVKEHSLMDFAVVDLVIKKLSPDSLIMMCQTNMEFRQDYLNRVRMNTILHWQVFSPLPFTEYYLNSMGPRNKELDINKNHGYYDTSFAKHISFYAMDYSK